MNVTITRHEAADGTITLTAEATRWAATVHPAFSGYRSVELTEDGFHIGDACAALMVADRSPLANTENSPMFRGFQY